MDFRAKQIAPPRHWVDFEDLCLALFRAEWNDPLALKNGRNGQPQRGVDVYGSPQREGALYYGVQCKGKDRNYGAKATVGEIKGELAKAQKFKPSLAHWIFATSASKDAKLQEAARLLSTERQAKGHFPVTVLGWEDIQSLLAQHPDVVENFYPEHAYDIASLIMALRDLPSGEDVRELRHNLKRVNETHASSTREHANPQWDLISFASHRDLGPALLGRGLGPADANACPRLQEADMVVAQLRRAFSARLIGEPGSGKSVCAYQAARDFAATGWQVYRMRHADIASRPPMPPTNDLCLLLVDDAHLMQGAVLLQIEEAANARHLVLSIHNGIGQTPLNRGAIVLDAKRAVRTIAAELLKDPEATLAAVRRADADVGLGYMDVPLEQRVDDAVRKSDHPWQFCFVLGGGWKRAKEAADAARAVSADLVLAGAAIIQMASRDAPLSLLQLQAFCEKNGIAPKDVSSAALWLVSQRLFLSDTDCRCPHQRFALAVLGRILDGQDTSEQAVVGRMLGEVVRDPSFSIPGLRLLLHELRFLGEYRQWTKLIKAEALEPLIARCWNASSADDQAFASLLFSDLDAYIERWYERIGQQHVLTIADWIMRATPPTAYGLSHLMNSLRNDNPAIAGEIVKAVNPEVLAQSISTVRPETAGHCAELIQAIGWERPDTWKATFDQVVNREALVALSGTWPSSASLYAFAQLCSAIHAWDEDLGLAMTEAFVKRAQQALTDDPVSAFRKMDDIFSGVLRLSDPLGVYVGKLAPNRRRARLGKAICAPLKPKSIAVQLSEMKRRDFQDATFFLAVLKKISHPKFKATVSAIDWSGIASTIGDGWANLPHEAEIFLAVSSSSERARVLITQMVEQNLNRVEDFPPRIAFLMPEVAVRHIDGGKRIRLGQHDHFEFQFSAGLIAQLIKKRPELVETIVLPFEPLVARVLSQQHPSWYKDASAFLQILQEVSPASLNRILATVDPAKAEVGWAASLSQVGGAQQTVALLIESSLPRKDAVGEIARRLRKKFPARSKPRVHRRKEG